jgi:hypothetical protein
MGTALRYNSSMIDKDAGAGKSVVSNTSWFRDTPHYWPEASLPLAYAVACVEVVCKSSKKARILYNLLKAEIHHHWTNIGINTRT